MWATNHDHLLKRDAKPVPSEHEAVAQRVLNTRPRLDLRIWLWMVKIWIIIPNILDSRGGNKWDFISSVSGPLRFYVLFVAANLQLHFNSFPGAYLVSIELILCIMEMIILSPIWCDFIRDKIRIKEGVECSCSSKVALKIAWWSSAFSYKLINL